MRYHLTPVRMAILNKLTNNKCLWRKRNHCVLLVECRLLQPLWKAVWTCLKKLKMELPYDPVIPLLGIYLKKSKTLLWKNICTPIFIAVLFTITKIWKQPKCPSVDEWIKKLRYIYTMEYYWAKKKKKEGNITFWNSMDGPGECYVKWDKPVRERQVWYDFTYMWNLMNKTNKIETDS